MKSPLRLLALWLCLLAALGACSADTRAPDGAGDAIPRATVAEEPRDSQGKAALPATLRMAFLRTQQKAAGHDFVRGGDGVLRSRAGRYGSTAAVAATARGIRVSRGDGGGFELGMETTSVGREGAPASRGVLAPRAEGQELVLDREDDVEERHLAGPLGVEQSFVVRRRPPGNGALAIEVAFAGLTPEMGEGATDRVLLRDEGGLVRAGYRDLVAVDAEGRELAARMEVREAGVALVVDDAGAAYPVRVDPLLWTQEAELTASDGAAFDEFGGQVAVSGGTAVVGAYARKVGTNVKQGAAYVFVRSGSTWTQQAELTASDGAANDFFGYSVAVSGGTAIVGAFQHKVGTNEVQGAAYVFVQSGSTWTQQAELTASDGVASDIFAASVAVSGGTAIVSAPGHKVGSNALQGAAYIFVQSGATWTQQAELTASDGAASDEFGVSVAVSGGIAIVGAFFHQVGTAYQQGVAYIFAQSGSGWTQQAELVAGDGATLDHFGFSVAVSGGTAIVGASQHAVGGNAEQGAAYVFTQNGTSWTQQQELIASDGAPGDDFGVSVAVSGGTAIVGADSRAVGGKAHQGAAYVFVQGGTTWTQQAELIASDGAASDHFGYSVAVSGGTTVVDAVARQVGSNAYQGTAYVFSTGANGAACTTGSSCQSASCIDGVCCDTACGGGVTTDCQSCLGAMTGGADGTCALVKAAAAFVCRAPTGPCDAAGTCDGTATTCPADATQSDGTSCGAGQVCSAGVCASECFIAGTLYPGATVNPSNACQACLPGIATTSWSDATDGTGCDDGDACTQTDSCQKGVCTGGDPKTCFALDECFVTGTCNPATGACSSPTEPDGTPCSLGTCHAGACTATPDGGSGSGGGAGGGTSSSASGSGGSKTSSTGSAGAAAVAFGGCGCRVAGDEGEKGGTSGLVAFGAVALVVAARRKRAG